MICTTKNKTVSLVIIEDYKLTRMGLCSALNEYEFINVVGEAENAIKGIELVKSLKPDVVLMDLGLPEMNGFEATMKIKEMYPETKVFVLTSRYGEEEVKTALGAGANGYCLKNVTPDILSEAIRVVAEGVCWFDSEVSDIILKMFDKPDNPALLPSSNVSEPKTQLTERESEVLKLLVEGKSNAQIAQHLIVSVHTAKAHVCSILQKLCVDDRVQAAVKAIREKLV